MSVGRGWLILLASVSPALILVLIFRMARRAPEPWPRVLACAAGGGAWVLAAAGIEIGFDRTFGPFPAVLRAFLLVAPVEEIGKLLSARLLGPAPARYPRVSSGIVYGIAAGVGFALVENIQYTLVFGVETSLMRAVTAVPGHALHGAAIGLGLGLSHRAASPQLRRGAVGLGLGLAVFLHGAYDAALVGGGSLRGLAVGVLAAEFLLVASLIRFFLERDLQSDLVRLTQVPLFAQLPVAVLRTLVSRGTHELFRPGRLLVKQGAFGEDMFVLLQGKLAVDVDGEFVRELTEGDFLGEQAILTGGSRLASVRAVSPAQVLRIPRQELLRAVRRSPPLAHTLLDAAAHRFPSGTLPTPEALIAQAEASESPLQGLALSLASLRIFHGLPREALLDLARSAQRRSCRPGRAWIEEGKQGPGLCFILSGAAEVRFPDRVVELAEGDVVGEMGLLTGWPAQATVAAVETTEILLVDWPGLRQVVGQTPEVGVRLLDTMGNRLVPRAQPRARRPSTIERVVDWAQAIEPSPEVAPRDTEDPRLDALAADPDLLRKWAQKLIVTGTVTLSRGV